MRRLIDAEPLKELFPDNGEGSWTYNATVKAYIDAQPSVQPNTTTHDSISAETGKNDGDRTTYDYISRQKAIDALRKMQTYKLFAGDDMILIDKAQVQTELMMLPPVQPEHCEDAVSREAVLSMIDTYMNKSVELHYLPTSDGIKKLISILPSAQPERKTGHWILDRSGAYCCSNCMEPCASYAMMKPRDRYCKMCGSRNEVAE